MTTTIVATVIVLGVLILVHELGHYFAAKWVGIEVQRFSIGLGPRVFGVRRGETEYVLSAVPLGGYVKMGGMGDEVMEKIEGGAEQARPPSERDFDAKPLWARAFVISAGVIMNMVFAFVTYSTVNAIWGEPELSSTRIGMVRESTLPPGTEALAEIPVGASVVRVGDRAVETWGDLTRALAEMPAGSVYVETVEPALRVLVRLPTGEAARVALVGSLADWVDAGVGAVEPGSPADRADLRAGDRILAVDGELVASWGDFVDRIRARPEQRVELLVEREGERSLATLTPEATTEVDAETGEERTIGRVGIYNPVGETAYRRVGAVEALRLGVRETVGATSLIVGFLAQLITGGISPRTLGSIVTIGEVSGQAAEAGIEVFLNFMAFFSVNLAVLNLLPIPVLDGGHLVFLSIEAVRGRALSVEQRLRWSNVGLLIVVGIMLLALSNDFRRFFDF